MSLARLFRHCAHWRCRQSSILCWLCSWIWKLLLWRRRQLVFRGLLRQVLYGLEHGTPNPDLRQRLAVRRWDLLSSWQSHRIQQGLLFSTRSVGWAHLSTSYPGRKVERPWVYANFPGETVWPLAKIRISDIWSSIPFPLELDFLCCLPHPSLLPSQEKCKTIFSLAGRMERFIMQTVYPQSTTIFPLTTSFHEHSGCSLVVW